MEGGQERVGVKVIGLRRELGELFWPLFDHPSEQLELKSAGRLLGVLL